MLLMPLPEAATAVAFDVLHEMVVEAGAVPLDGLALIAPDTDAEALTTTVVVCVAGPFAP